MRYLFPNQTKVKRTNKNKTSCAVKSPPVSRDATGPGQELTLRPVPRAASRIVCVYSTGKTACARLVSCLVSPTQITILAGTDVKKHGRRKRVAGGTNNRGGPPAALSAGGPPTWEKGRKGPHNSPGRDPIGPCRPARPILPFLPAGCVRRQGGEPMVPAGVTAEVGTWEDEEGRTSKRERGTDRGRKREKEEEVEVIHGLPRDLDRRETMQHTMSPYERNCCTTWVWTAGQVAQQ